MPRITATLFLAVVLCLGCSASDPAAKAPGGPTVAPAASSTAAPQSLIPLPATPSLDAKADVAIFRNADLGLEFSYPRRLDTASNGACRPALQSDGRVIGIGSNVSISVQRSQGEDLAAVAQAFLRRVGASEEKRGTVANFGGGQALRIEYRLLPSSRFGIATFAIHAGHSYTLVFEARNPGQCDESSPTELYEQILQSLRFR